MTKTMLLFVVALVGLHAPTIPATRDGAGQSDVELKGLITGWNGRVYAIAVAEDRLLTLKGLRTAVMMHIAIHDALNAIDPRYEPFALETAAERADAVAAAAQAAYEVVAGQYPDHAHALHADLITQLAMVGEGRGKSAGIELGEACAAAITRRRQSDGWNSEADYAWHPMGPGVYAEFNEHSGTPEGFVFGAGWAKARPFVLSRPDQFRASPPPAIDSDDYVAAFREVKEVGRFQSMTRTPDQTHLALWWKDFVENSHNRLARQLVAAEDIDAWSAARMFALLNVGVYDAYVNVFDNKFHFNHWRPYTAIRWAAHDGNADTEPDTLWDNTHRHTYAFPSYPSAHGAASAAAMTVLGETFGDRYAFTMYTPVVDAAGPMSEKISMQPATRSFNSFSEAAVECAVSRVYLGIHFRYDSTEGTRLGNRVGGFIIENALRPLD